MFPQELTLLLVVFISHLSYVSCDEDAVVVPRAAKPSDLAKLTPSRTYAVAGSCTCGRDTHATIKTWTVYIHLKNGNETRPGRNTKVCIGTVLASNMIISSHLCLLSKSKKLNDYADIRISTSHYPPKVGPPIVKNREFSIKKIILQTPDASSQNADIALIFVKETITDNAAPICLPHLQKKWDVINRDGYFYGLGGILENDVTPESRRVANITIVSGAQCNKERSGVKASDKNYNDALCIRFPIPAPVLTGGPLVLKTKGKTKYDWDAAAYLVGLSSMTKVETKTSSSYNYVYFTNVLANIKHIERYATEHGSKWCYPQENITFTPPSKVKVDAPKKYKFEEVTVSKRPETLDCVCGIKNNPPPKARIAGGEEAIPYEFGWMAKMLFSYDGEHYFGCGASIINDRVIVTAAHCLYDRSKGGYAKETHVYLRVHNDDEDTEQLKLDVKETLIHPSYIYQKEHDPDGGDNDVGIIILANPVEFSKGTTRKDVEEDDVRPICLPVLGRYVESIGKEALVAGWGLTDAEDDESSALKLQKLMQPVLHKTECIERDFMPFTDNLICAGTFNKLKDAQPVYMTTVYGPIQLCDCHPNQNGDIYYNRKRGDSGGPFILKENGLWTLIGVVSRGDPGFDYDKFLKGDKTKFEISVYADVQKMLKFVEFHSNRVGAQWCRSKM